jgi:glyoxylase-like metal-dependent hydrolase (beta-lactamase superfamily II)/rhodanese-related sulfurtransferase
MVFRQFINEDLGCASYFVADAGEAAIVDPQWDIAPYLDLADAEGVSITHVLETHFHADHVSGRARLAEKTGAKVHVPRDPAREHAGGTVDGDVIRVGSVRITAIGAPGHRPEHLAYLVTGDPESDATTRLLAGDSLLVGEMARPDLAVDAVEGAEALFDTAHRLVALGDDVELWPGHVSGSLCGAGNLCDDTSSTIGQELVRNRLLAIEDAPDFIAEVTKTIPTRPPRVAKIVALNVRGVRSPGPIPEIDATDLQRFAREGTCLLDVRVPESFDVAHLAGAVNLPASAKGVGTRAGWVTREDEPIVIVTPSHDVGLRVGSLLLAAGVWNIVGMSVADPDAWSSSGLTVRSAQALTPEDLAPRLLADEVQLIDVRDGHEWRTGHVSGSIHLPLSALSDGRRSTGVLPRGREFAVACARGPRAAVATSVLRRGGVRDVRRVVGGIGNLAELGVPLVQDDERAAPATAATGSPAAR